MKTASRSRRPQGGLDGDACSPKPASWGLKPRKTKTPKQQDHRRPTNSESNSRSNNRSNSSSKDKLQELKLAFSLLSRELQGPDEGEEVQVPAVTIDEKKASPPSATAPTKIVADLSQQRSSSVPPPAVASNGASQQLGGSNLTASSNVILTEKPVDGLKRVKHAVSRTAGRKAAQEEVAGKEAEQALRRLKAELGAEIESRKTAEAAGKEADQALDQLKAEIVVGIESRQAAEAARKEAEQALVRLKTELGAERRSRIVAERWGTNTLVLYVVYVLRPFASYPAWWMSIACSISYDVNYHLDLYVLGSRSKLLRRHVHLDKWCSRDGTAVSRGIRAFRSL